MRIVLDTNVIRQNWLLKGPSMSLIERFARSGKCRLLVPEIVILEAKNLYREELVSRAKALAKAVKELNSLVFREAAVIPSLDTEQVCKEYEEGLNERLDNLKAERIPHSGIPHEAIVSRALACRKPFRKSDKGYRDTLIWEGILNVAGSDCTTFFISNDREDFASPANGGNLHPDLVEDLRGRNLPTDCVRLYTEIKQFVDDHIVPYLEQVAGEAMAQLKKGHYKSFSIRDWFLKHRDQFVTPLSEDPGSVFSGWPELEDPEVSYIEDPEEITVENVFSLEEDTVYIHAIAFADTTVDGFVFKPDYYTLGDEYPLEILDSDWGENYVWAQLTLHLPIRFSVTLNLLSEQVEEVEVDGFGETFGWCKSCGAAVLNDAAESCRRCGRSLF